MHYQTLTDICPAAYPLSCCEKVLAAAVLYHLRSISEQEARQLMAGIIQPKLLTLPDQESRLPIVLSSTIQGKWLAALLDTSVGKAVEELENLKTYPGCEALEQGYLNLRGFSGKRALQSITPEFCAFLVDCYRVLRW